MTKDVIKLWEIKRYFLMGEYIVKALDGVTLSIQEGEFTAIMGPSGSGKSTLMNLIGCLDTPTDGLIEIDGEETLGMSEGALAYIRTRKWALFSSSSTFSAGLMSENVMTLLLCR